MGGKKGKKKRDNKREKGNRESRGPSPVTSAQEATPTVAPSRSEEVEKVEAVARNAGLSPSPATVTPDEDFAALLRRLRGVITAYENARGSADKEVQECQRQSSLLAQRAEKLDQRQRELDQQQQALAKLGAKIEVEGDELKAQVARSGEERKALHADRAKLAQTRAELIRREEQLEEREADAEAGFIRSRERSLTELKRAHAELLAKARAQAESLEREQQEHTERLQLREREHRESLENKNREAEIRWGERNDHFASREQELNERERKIKARTLALQLEEKDLEEDREAIEELARTREAKRQVRLKEELEREHQLRAELHERCHQLETQLEEVREASRTLDNQRPEVLRRQLDDQQRTIRELEAALDERPTIAEAEELASLRDDRVRQEDERRTLLADLQRTRRQLETLEHDAVSMDLLKQRNLALEENARLLRAALDELRNDIDDRLDKHRDQPVFPELTRIDTDPNYSTSLSSNRRSRDKNLDLKEFAQDLQHRIGIIDDPEQPDLYYNPEDIRALLGGLAMSRLHLLQGISGIGKSSLPRRFAAALGGLCETVSVQAGWRDRNDLLGYYNAFERRYYESSFVQALYKAQSPRYKDLLTIVLLDEMNLSHPEQYAADVLDVLERRDRDTQRFELMSCQQSGPVPAGLSEGRFLPLPANVWFVGTANHDETTKDFADKTYDRSFILTLPERPKTVPLKTPPPREPVAVSKIRDAFDRARQDHTKPVKKGLDWMTSHLAPLMAERFGVGFGGRLEQQAATYTAVVCAAGGTLSEAVDQVITTRLLRRLRGRHDLMVDDLRELVRLLENTWLNKKEPPTRGLNLLQRELRRLGADL